MSDWNANVIAQFRANEGLVGGPWEGRNLLLLHSLGARSKTERVNPLAYQALGEGAWAIFGSKGGAPTHPDWYYNLVANPKAKIEVGTETVDVVAREAEGEERDGIWAIQKRDWPGFADYERKTDRGIPVVILEAADR